MFYRTCVVSVFNESSRPGVVLTAIATTPSSSFVVTVILSEHCVSCNRNSFLVDLYSQKIINLRQCPSVTKILANWKQGKLFACCDIIITVRCWVDNIIKCHGNTSWGSDTAQGGNTGQLSVSTFYKGMLCESLNKGVHLSTPVCHHQQEEATPRYLTDSRSTKKLFTIKSKWIKIIP